MTTATLAPIAGPAQHSPEWLAAHRTNVTASRMAAILGQSDYATALDVFLEMTGRRPPFEGNEFTRRGTRYEPAIIGDYCETKGVEVEYPVPMFFHPTIHGFAASPDAIITPDRLGLVEAKWTMSAARAAELGEEGTDSIPADWIIQNQSQLAVMGAEYVDQAILLYGRLKVYRVQRHPGLIATIEAAAKEFIERIADDDAPEANYEHDGARAALRTLYGLDEGLVIDLTDDQADVWERRQDASARESAAKKEKEALDAEMLDILHGAAVAWTPEGGKISRKVITVGPKTVPGYEYERFYFSKPKSKR